jgi:hypothetical protein
MASPGYSVERPHYFREQLRRGKQYSQARDRSTPRGPAGFCPSNKNPPPLQCLAPDADTF